MLPEIFQKVLHIFRYRRFETHQFLRGRMGEGEQPGMQCLPVETAHGLFQRFRQLVGLGLVGAAIVHVADKRMADMRHVHADLVGATGLKAAFDERGQCGCIFKGANFSTVT